MMSFRQIVLAAALTLVPAAAMADDRPPTPEERVKIEAALKAEGYTAWEKIELDDDDGWEVDDALFSDGKRYDLKLDPQTLKIIDRDD